MASRELTDDELWAAVKGAVKPLSPPARPARTRPVPIGARPALKAPLPPPVEVAPSPPPPVVASPLSPPPVVAAPARPPQPAQPPVVHAPVAAALAERIAELEALLAGTTAERDAADRALRTVQADAARGGRAPTIRDRFRERGLRSEDEMIAAIAGLCGQRRVRELLEAGAPHGFDLFLDERVVLLAEGEDAPNGQVTVRVAEERSEREPPSRVRAAMRRFEDACLTRGVWPVVFVGGSPSYHKQLRELHRRLDVRIVDGRLRNIRTVTSAKLVIAWGGTLLDHRVTDHFPEAVLIPHRGIAVMLERAAEWVEGRP